jgi:D-proline reductase (dithiol) PrdB
MATYLDLSRKYRFFMKAYPFSRYRIHPLPATIPTKPVNLSRVAIVTTAGFHTPEQIGFDQSIRSGDTSFREIPNTVEVASLLESHKSDAFDHSGIEADRNLAFPLDRFRELQAQRKIGELNHRHFSVMGSITKPEKLIADTAPCVAQLLSDDEVDIVFLTPV